MWLPLVVVVVVPDKIWGAGAKGPLGHYYTPISFGEG
jgi:hypothetical protein